MSIPDTQPTRSHPDYARIVADLTYRFDGVFSPETVREAVEDARTILEPTSRILDFLCRHGLRRRLPGVSR